MQSISVHSENLKSSITVSDKSLPTVTLITPFEFLLHMNLCVISVLINLALKYRVYGCITMLGGEIGLAAMSDTTIN
jgi:hypothetical protein